MSKTKTTPLYVGLFLIGILGLSCLSTSVFTLQNDTLAQQYIPTIKYRNLVIDLGNGVKTKAQLTYPAIGKGPFPGVLLIHGSGANDKNETLGYVHKGGPKPTTPFWQIAQYLSERGFAVLRYDKRGIGANYTIDQNVWGNATVNDLIHDAEKALNVLTMQPEVDAKRISLIGHSEGTAIVPRVAIDNPTKVKNIILMGTVAQNLIRDILRYQVVDLNSEYARQVLDKNHTGQISIQQIPNDPLLGPYLVSSSLLDTNNTKAIINNLFDKFGTGHVSIQKQIRPALIKYYENESAFSTSKCNSVRGCPVWFRSESGLTPTLGIIGNISKSTGILLLNGENDSATPVQQTFLLQQRLTEVNHPNHMLITYPNLGHFFYPSPQWFAESGPIEPYVLADLYAWLESHSGFTTPAAAAAHVTSTPSSNSTAK
ncbi:MAG: alpha/beta fold hydrolase [Nitrososphaeraceae archaeon]